MAELDITLTIYSDDSKSNQVARISLYPGPEVEYNIMSCWDWAKQHGFTVYNPSIYDPRFESQFKDAGTDVLKSQVVKWLNEGVLSTKARQKVDGTTQLRYYPATYIFNLKFVDWS